MLHIVEFKKSKLALAGESIEAINSLLSELGQLNTDINWRTEDTMLDWTHLR